jgi:hypothetical protein
VSAGDPLAGRFAELVAGVVAPLVLGGAVQPVRPFGALLGLTIGEGRTIDDAALAARIGEARVRRARLYAPVDALPDLDAPSFALAAALNDLIQLTNHELAGALTRGRYARLWLNLRFLCDRIPPPADVGAALSRHATFGRVFELVRTDSTVSWWTGSARFRGQAPPGRLLVWPELRKVTVDARRVPLSEMREGTSGVSTHEFHEVLALWLRRSPLTDLAGVARQAPAFGWSSSTLGLIGTAPGRTLAFRAALRQPAPAAASALARAAKEVPASLEQARRLADEFAAEVAEGARLMLA